MHPDPVIEGWRQLHAAHVCLGGCQRRDRQHWYFPRKSFTGIAKAFTRLNCADWPNVEPVCYYWHHSEFNPEYDRPKFSPDLPAIPVMRRAVEQHGSRVCGCYQTGVIDDAAAA